MRILIASLVVACSVALAAPPSDQANPPNVSGSWKTIIDKSTFPGTPPLQLTGVIKQEGDKMVVTQTTVEADGNSSTVTLEFNTAGKLTINKIDGTELRTVMKADGGILREETDFTTPQSRFKRKSTMSVSPDGKTLIMDGIMYMNDGENKIKLVMQKQ